HQRERDQDVRQARTADSDDRNREDDYRESQEDVDQAHDHRVPEATQITGDYAARDTDRTGQRHRDDADPQRHARAVQQARKDVATELVGSEKVRATRRLQAAFER